MIIKIPRSSEYQRVLIEITGQNVHRVIEASSDVAEVTPHLPDGVREDGLTVTARFLNEAHKHMSAAIILQKPNIFAREENEEPEAEDYSDDEDDEVT